MDQFPVEILIRIFEQACFDDKRTGRSLTLASKVLANIVDPLRFEAVSLYGPSQICGFASMLQRCPENSGRIKHLFFSGVTVKEAEELRVVRMAAMKELAVRRGLADESYAVEQQPGFKLALNELERRVRRGLHCSTLDTPIDKIHQIIRDTARSLETLFITSTRSHYFSCLPCELPKLTVFSVTSATCFITLLHVFPKLKSIHSNCYLDPPDEYEPENLYLRTGAPVLEELRMTDMQYYNDDLLGHLVQHARCVEEGRKDRLVFPDTMRRVVVQQGPPLYKYSCSCLCLPWEEFGQDITNAAASLAEFAYRRDGFSLVVLEPLDTQYCFRHMRSGLGCFFEDARSEWMDVVYGRGDRY